MLKAVAERRARRLQESNGRRAFVLEGGDVLPGLSGEKKPVTKTETCPASGERCREPQLEAFKQRILK